MSRFPFRRDFWVVIALAAILFSPSCLVRRRTVAPAGQPANRRALTASKQELLARIHAVADPIQSFSLKVDMSPSVGGVFGGQVTDYPTIHGFILFQRPSHIRIIGLDPVIHSTILDMVSIGNNFRVSLPTKNQFIEGTNDAPAASKNKLENLRPLAFLNSLLINPPGQGEFAIFEDDTDATMAVYKVIFVVQDGAQLRVVRSVAFDRYSLDIARQRTFDAGGQVVSETKYSDWAPRGGLRFPGTIDMARPKDGYALQMVVTGFELNPPDVAAEKFVLNPPPDAQIRTLGP